MATPTPSRISRPSVGTTPSRPSIGSFSARDSATGLVFRSGIRSFVNVRPAFISSTADEAADEAFAFDTPRPTASILETGIVRDLIHHSLNWKQASLLIVAEVLGTGVLALPGGLRVLGWIPGITALAVCYPINLYIGLLLERLRRVAPACITLADLAKATIGWHGSIIGRMFLVIYFVSLCGNYLVVMGTSLQAIVANKDGSNNMTQLVGVSISAAFVIFPSQLRTLENTTLLCIGSAVAMVVAIGLLLHEVVSTSCAGIAPEPDDSYGLFWDVLNAISSFLLACAGQTIYLEMMSEMQEPRNFTYSLHVAVPLLIALYVLVSAVTYAECGENTPGYLLDAIPSGTIVKRVVGALLFAHTLVSYTIQQQVLARNLHLMLDARHAVILCRGQQGYWRARIEWCTITLVQLGLAYALAVGVSSFSSIVNLIGALMVPPLCLIIPCACLVGLPFDIEFWEYSWIKFVESSFALVVLVVSVVLTVIGTIAALLPIVAPKGS